MDAEADQLFLQAVAAEQLGKWREYLLERWGEAVAGLVFAFTAAALLSPEKSGGVSCVAFEVPGREPQLAVLVVVEQPTFFDALHVGSGLLARPFAFLVNYFWLLFFIRLPCLSFLFDLLDSLRAGPRNFLLNLVKRRASSQPILTNTKRYLSSAAQFITLHRIAILIPIVLSFHTLQEIIGMVLILKPAVTLIAVHLLLAPAVLQRVDGLILVPEGTVAHLVLEA